MSPIAVVLLVAAVVLVGAVEWPRLSARLGVDRRRARERSRRKDRLRVVPSEPDDDFVRAVERDLAALPTIEDRD